MSKDSKILVKPVKKKAPTPNSFNAIEKSKESAKVQAGETAAVENHYVNGSFTHSTSNRGK